MKKDNNTKRERLSDGSVYIPKTSPELNKRQWEIACTYIFQRQDSKSGFFMDIFQYYGTPDGNPKTDEQAQNEGFFVENLVEKPKPPIPTSVSSNLNKRQRWAETYFQEVLPIGYFTDTNHGTRHLDWRFHNMVLDKESHESITLLTQSIGLSDHWPFLLQLLAQAQNEYVDNIRIIESSEKKAEFKNIDNEVKTFTEVLRRFDERGKIDLSSKTESYPSEIAFKYNRDIHKITSPSIIYGILSDLLEKNSEPPFDNWEYSMLRYVDSLNRQAQYLEFKERLTIALHEWLTKENIIPLQGTAKTSEKALKFIAGFIKIAQIPFEGKKTSQGDEVKILRNYLKRKQLIRYPKEFRIERQNNNLAKHFPEWFLKQTTSFKTREILETGYDLAYRFNMAPLGMDLVNIVEALRNMKRIPYFNYYIIPGLNQDLPEVDSFIRLFESVKPTFSIQKPNPLTSLKFTVQGSKKVHELTQAVPLSMIHKALTEYAHKHPEDLNFDLVAQDFYFKNEGDHLPHVRHKDEFNPLEKRFFPKLCYHFYQYLLEFSPPADREAFPARRYFQIITVTLIKAFKEEIHDASVEERMMEKVIAWYELAKKDAHLTS